MVEKAKTSPWYSPSTFSKNTVHFDVGEFAHKKLSIEGPECYVLVYDLNVSRATADFVVG